MLKFNLLIFFLDLSYLIIKTYSTAKVTITLKCVKSNPESYFNICIYDLSLKNDLTVKYNNKNIDIIEPIYSYHIYYIIHFPAPEIGQIEIIINTNKNILNLKSFLAHIINSHSFESITIKNSGSKISIGNMEGFFSNIYSVKLIDLSEFDISEVTSFESCFIGCTNLISVKFGNFSVKNVDNMKNMFYLCEKLESLDLSSFDTSKVTTMESLFDNCYKLSSINNISNFNVSKVTTVKQMFKDCYSLTSLDLTNFISSEILDTSFMFLNCESLSYLNVGNFVSGVNNMSGMFSFCRSLVSLDLNNFNTPNATIMQRMFEECNTLTYLKIDNFDFTFVQDTSYMFYNCKMLGYMNFSNYKANNITNMKEMFNGCNSLTSLDMENFIVSRIENMEKMFFSCSSLKSLNLINFNTSLTTNMESMFYGCSSLIYLNINNFDTRRVNKMGNMFKDCAHITSLNLSNFQISENVANQNMFQRIAENAIFCFNEDFYKKIETQINEKKCSLIDFNCIPDWNIVQKKIIEEKGNCVDYCNLTENYKYEYEGKCYSSCPKGTTSLYNNNFICEIFEEKKLLENNNIFTNKNNTEENTIDQKIKTTDIIIKENNNNNIFYKICRPQDFLANECTPIKMNFDSMISMIKNDISQGSLNDILEDVLNEKKVDIFKEDENIKYQITSSFNQKNKIYENISIIDLKQCEDKLKSEYNINPNVSLIIFKYDYTISNSLVPMIGYEVFHPTTKEILDLSICKENKNKIELIVPVELKENEVYKHDPNNIYYNDKCYSNQNEKVDMTLYERKNEYNNKNLALCASNCEFEEYNNTTKKVKCICQPQYNSSLITLDKIINKEKILHSFTDIESTTNIYVIKCYKKFLSFKGLKNNIGSYILLSFFLIYVIGVFVVFFKDRKDLFDKMDLEFKNFEENNDINLILNNPIKKDLSNNNLKSKNTRFINSIDNSTKKFKKGKSKNANIELNNHKKKEYNNNKFKKKIIYNDSELNLMEYPEAKKSDKRTFLQFYFSLVKTRHPLISPFLFNKDYNSITIKILLFFFSFALSFILNSLFFTDETIHKICEDNGIFNFIYNIPNIIYSTLISIIIDIIIKKLALTEDSIIDLKKEKKSNDIHKKVEKTKKNIIIKLILFFIISFILLGIFWFYIGCFCAVYTNTQIYLLKDTLISFALSLLIPFIKFLVSCLLRNYSLKEPGNCLYKLSKMLQ